MSLAIADTSRAIAYCDNNAAAQSVLQRQMQRGKLYTAPIIDDVAHITQALRGRRATMITAGFPCKGFSVAGAHHGMQHVETALFRYVLALAKQMTPALIFLENTPSIGQPQHLTLIQSSLARLGYKLAHCCITAQMVGLPQIRNRWFGLAYTQNCTRHLRALNRMSLNLQHRHEPPTTCAEQIVHMEERWHLLKNAVVPNCARLALVHLSQHVLAGHTATLLLSPPQQHPASHRTIILKHVKTIIHKQCWPTLHGRWQRHGCTLNARNACDLPTAVFYATCTPPGVLNIKWAEWLMGYPSDWTR